MARYAKAITAFILAAAFLATQLWPELDVPKYIDILMAALIPLGVWAVPNTPPGINAPPPTGNVP